MKICHLRNLFRTSMSIMSLSNKTTIKDNSGIQIFGLHYTEIFMQMMYVTQIHLYGGSSKRGICDTNSLLHREFYNVVTYNFIQFTHGEYVALKSLKKTDYITYLQNPSLSFLYLFNMMMRLL